MRRRSLSSSEAHPSTCLSSTDSRRPLVAGNDIRIVIVVLLVPSLDHIHPTLPPLTRSWVRLIPAADPLPTRYLNKTRRPPIHSLSPSIVAAQTLEPLQPLLPQRTRAAHLFAAAFAPSFPILAPRKTILLLATPPLLSERDGAPADILIPPPLFKIFQSPPMTMIPSPSLPPSLRMLIISFLKSTSHPTHLLLSLHTLRSPPLLTLQYLSHPRVLPQPTILCTPQSYPFLTTQPTRIFPISLTLPDPHK